MMTPETLLSLLADRGYDLVTTHHPPLFTVEDGKEWHDRIPGCHGKNLFIVEQKTGQPWLVSCRADSRPDLNALGRDLAVGRFSFGKEDLLLDILGVTPGSVTPFALVNDHVRRTRVILEAELVAAGQVNFHPLSNSMSTTLAAVDLIDFIHHLGFMPVIRSLPQRPAI